MSSILTLNAGSSSLKFGLFDPATPDPICRATGLVDRIGSENGAITVKSATGEVLAQAGPPPIPDHAEAVVQALALIHSVLPEAEIAVVGHRVVHGGTEYDAPKEVDDAVLAELERLSPFAPLHQPHNLAGIRAAHRAFPQARQIACFDTAFHRGQPFENDAFALPITYFEKGVRRYGFHGLSYDYIAGHLAAQHPTLHAGRVVVAHLGNGASMCGLREGCSIASTMGFSALDGLPMGTRTGRLDPGVLLYLMEQEKMGASEISDLLYKRSGLLGLSGLSNDMRTLEAAGTDAAERAIRLFTGRIRHELGGLAADLGGLDAIVFTGGIGENSRRVRAEVSEGLAWWGVSFDAAANAANDTVISGPDSAVQVLVIPTNEELVIARAAAELGGAV